MVIMSFGATAQQYAKEQAIEKEAQKIIDERDCEVILDILTNRDELRVALVDLLVPQSKTKLKDMSVSDHFRLAAKADKLSKKFHKALREYVDDGSI